MQLVKIPNDISTTIDNTALFTIKYLRCGSKGGRVSFTFANDVIGIQRALIDWSVAVAVFRRSKLRLMSGELLVTSRQLRQIGFNVTVEQLIENPNQLNVLLNYRAYRRLVIAWIYVEETTLSRCQKTDGPVVSSASYRRVPSSMFFLGQIGGRPVERNSHRLLSLNCLDSTPLSLSR